MSFVKDLAKRFQPEGLESLPKWACLLQIDTVKLHRACNLHKEHMRGASSSSGSTTHGRPERHRRVLIDESAAGTSICLLMHIFDCFFAPQGRSGPPRRGRGGVWCAAAGADV
jgi:hypothetical protein